MKNDETEKPSYRFIRKKNKELAQTDSTERAKQTANTQEDAELERLISAEKKLRERTNQLADSTNRANYARSP